MENEHPYRRNAFDMYKELKIYFINRVFEVIDYNCKGTVMSLPFLWVKISSRGVIVKEKNSGKEIHFKYSSIDSVHDGALKCEDVELYTPFIKENDGVKFITWNEWNEKYNTEEICKRITTVTDEHLKEHNTDLMYILDKMCVCAADRCFDHPHRFIKVEPRYQDNEYSLHRVSGEFKYHRTVKKYDYIGYSFEYTAKNHSINIEITKHETWYTPTMMFPSVVSKNVETDLSTDKYNINIEFNKDYNVSKVYVANISKENILNFIDMGNAVIKDTIKTIMNYINCKLTYMNCSTYICNNISVDNKHVQVWEFSNRPTF